MSGIPESPLGIPWDALMSAVGQPGNKFLLELITIPIFSAIAGVLTNWTGVLMLFTPVKFTGIWVPGLKTVFPMLHRKVQVLPCFAPGGILGFQAVIPARAEKMACLLVDKVVYKIGTIDDIWNEIDPNSIAEHVAQISKKEFRPLVVDLMEKNHLELWKSLPPQAREALFKRVEAELPDIIARSFAQVGENLRHLVDVKLLAVMFLKRNPDVLRDLIQGVAAPELKFMIRVGLLGFPLGIILALYLQVHHSIPLIQEIPTWLAVLTGAALIGIAVNVICLKMVFTPGDPQPRYKYLWKQARLAKRQPEAAADMGHALAYQVLTLDILANEVLHGVRGDRAMAMIRHIMNTEIKRMLGPLRTVARTAVGPAEFDNLQAEGMKSAMQLTPTILEDAEFIKTQSAKVEKFATQKLQELPPADFMDLIYSAIEQDAWLLYVHGGLLGIVVGAAHIAIFGA